MAPENTFGGVDLPPQSLLWSTEIVCMHTCLIQRSAAHSEAPSSHRTRSTTQSEQSLRFLLGPELLICCRDVCKVQSAAAASPGIAWGLRPLKASWVRPPHIGMLNGRVRGSRRPVEAAHSLINHLERTRCSAGGRGEEVLPLVLSSPGEDHDHLRYLSGTWLQVLFLVSDSLQHYAYTAAGNKMRAL